MAEVSMEAAFTAVNSEDAVEGDDGPVMRFPAKRKAVADEEGRVDVHQIVVQHGLLPASAVDFKENVDASKAPASAASAPAGGSKGKVRPPLGEIKLDIVGASRAPVSAAPTGGSKGKDRLPLGEVKLKQVVDASKAPASAGGGKGKVRLPLGDVKLILSLKKELPSIDYLDYLAEYYTPEEITERRRKHEEEVALCQKLDADFEVFQKEVRDSILKNGYFEVDDDYLEKREEFNAWTKEQWARINKTKLRFCAPDADQATQGYVEDDSSDSDSELDG